MLNKNTIKSEVKKQFNDVTIVSIDHKSFGIFVVKVEKFTTKTKKTAFVFGETNFEISSNGVVLDKKVNWF